MPVRSGAQATQATNKEAPKAAKTGSNTGKTSARKGTYAHQTLGFGVPATSDPHHFKVVIPKANSASKRISVVVSMHFGSMADSCLLFPYRLKKRSPLDPIPQCAREWYPSFWIFARDCTPERRGLVAPSLAVFTPDQCVRFRAVGDPALFPIP